MLLLVLLIGIPVLLWIAFRDQNEGTPEEMAANPELNTLIREIHYKRLQAYKRSKYRGQWEYMGPRGGIYTITAVRLTRNVVIEEGHTQNAINNSINN